MEISVENDGEMRNICPVLFLPDLKLLPRHQGQLEEVPEKRDSLGPWWQLSRAIVLDGSDCVDRYKSDGHTK